MTHWPEQPVNIITKWLKDHSPSFVVADFGCGNANRKCYSTIQFSRLFDSLRQSIFSILFQVMLGLQEMSRTKSTRLISFPKTHQLLLVICQMHVSCSSIAVWGLTKIWIVILPKWKIGWSNMCTPFWMGFLFWSLDICRPLLTHLRWMLLYFVCRWWGLTTQVTFRKLTEFLNLGQSAILLCNSVSYFLMFTC